MVSRRRQRTISTGRTSRMVDNNKHQKHTLVLEPNEITLQIHIDGMHTHLTFIYPNSQRSATILTSDLKSLLYDLKKDLFSDDPI